MADFSPSPVADSEADWVDEPDSADPGLIPARQRVRIMVPGPDFPLLAEDEEGLTRPEIQERAELRRIKQDKGRALAQAATVVEASRRRSLEVLTAEERQKVACDLVVQVDAYNQLRTQMENIDRLLSDAEIERQATLRHIADFRRRAAAQDTRTTQEDVRRQRRELHERRLLCPHNTGFVHRRGVCNHCPGNQIVVILVCLHCGFASCWSCLVQFDKRFEAASPENSVDDDHDAPLATNPSSSASGVEADDAVTTLLSQTSINEGNEVAGPAPTENAIDDDDGPSPSIMFEDSSDKTNIPSSTMASKVNLQSLLSSELDLQKTSNNAMRPSSTETSPTRPDKSITQDVCRDGSAHRYIETIEATRCQNCHRSNNHDGFRCLKCTKTICTPCKTAQSPHTTLTD